MCRQKAEYELMDIFMNLWKALGLTATVYIRDVVLEKSF